MCVCTHLCMCASGHFTSAVFLIKFLKCYKKYNQKLHHVEYNDGK